jgi:hypothetical protein
LSPNQYLYVLDDPINYVDAEGRAMNLPTSSTVLQRCSGLASLDRTQVGPYTSASDAIIRQAYPRIFGSKFPFDNLDVTKLDRRTGGTPDDPDRIICMNVANQAPGASAQHLFAVNFYPIVLWMPLGGYVTDLNFVRVTETDGQRSDPPKDHYYLYRCSDGVLL